MEAIEKEVWDRVMSQKEVEVTRLTSVQLLDAAIWREIGTEEPQPAPAFLEALSALVGRWLIARSSEPEMDVVTVMCRARVLENWKLMSMNQVFSCGFFLGEVVC
jgi:hypothetical protein